MNPDARFAFFYGNRQDTLNRSIMKPLRMIASFLFLMALSLPQFYRRPLVAEEFLLSFDDIEGTVGDQYPGVHFSPGWTVWNSTGHEYYPPHSEPNVAYTRERQNSIRWDSYVLWVRVFINCLPGESYTYAVYDRNGSLLDTYTGFGVVNYELVFEVEGIRELRVSGTGNWFTQHTIDDLQYDGLVLPTATPTATPEPLYSYTPIQPSPTLTVTPSPTATPPPPTATVPPPSATPKQNSPTPAPTPVLPTPSPTSPPVPTGTPPGEPAIELKMPATYYRSGDVFSLDVRVANPGEPRGLKPLFIILDVYGEYWFWPSWKQQLDYHWIDLQSGSSTYPVIASFFWPEGAGSADGIVFWGGLTDERITVVIGLIDTIAWGYGV